MIGWSSVDSCWVQPMFGTNYYVLTAWQKQRLALSLMKINRWYGIDEVMDEEHS